MAEGEITVFLRSWQAGDARAIDQLLPVVYDELRRVARRQLLRESPAHTLSATALVHEVYLRLVQQRQLAVDDRQHFFAACANTMRRILVDHARARLRKKRAGERVDLDVEQAPALLAEGELEEVLAIETALERLAAESPRAVRIVECRIFAGMTLDETAEALGLSERSVRRTWNAAAAWLRKEIGADRLLVH